MLEALGRMFAVDMLVNNFDRAPLVHLHKGNANNLLYTADGGVVAIDQTSTAIKDGDGVKAYIERVVDAVKEAKVKATSGPAISRVMPLSHMFSWRLLVFNDG